MSGNPTHSCPEHGSRSRGRSLCHSGPRTLLHPCWNWWSFRSIRARSPDRGSKESAKDRAKVQTTMEAEVLRVSEYPQVTFESTDLTAAVPPMHFAFAEISRSVGKPNPSSCR
jgi:hypothetical protein